MAVINTPIFLDTAGAYPLHKSFGSGDTLASSFIKISVDVGNGVKIGADGGIFAAKATSGTYDNTTKKATITNSDASTFTIDFTALASGSTPANPPAATSPTPASDGTVSTNIIGGKTETLGKPDGYHLIGGKKVPYYN